MDPLLISAASGMKARMESLDMLANNIANTGTVGFKADREFYRVLQAGLFQANTEVASASPSTASGGPLPAGAALRNRASAQLPLIEKHWTDFSQGVLLPSGNPLDLALDGDGFFALNGPASNSPASNSKDAAASASTATSLDSAPDSVGGTTPGATGVGTSNSNIIYSRSGRFQISRNNQLATAEGFTLRNASDQGRPITVNPALAIEVAGDGTVSQEGKVLGRIEIGGIANPAQSLSKMGSSYFARLSPDAAQPANGLQSDKPPVVKQGMLEQSNVGTTDAAVRLVGVMRQFEMMQRAMTLGTEMNKRALDEVARFS
ncbi:MAG: flagellar hook-basal body complex protein [Acidobacteriota bacterium]